MAFDILIKNGILIDGTGRERYPADVGINKNAIAEIGDLKNQKAEKVIDAANLHVVPGFIDVLNHSDTYWTMFPMPSMESLLRQGITTIIGGNCGASLAPLVEGNVIAAIQKWADMSEVSINWLRMSEFLEQLERMKFGVNFGTLVGHGTLRSGLIKDEVRNLTGDEMAKIKFMLEEALESAAFGLSTGLAFSHAKTTPVEEIIELAKLVEKYDGVYASHLRDEAGRLDDSVTETIRVAMESQAKIQISHFKAMGQSGWPNFAANLERLEQAHDGGFNVNFDVFPYTVTGSVLYTLLPDWAAEGGKKKLLSRLRDPHERRKIIHELKKNPLAEYDKIIVAISPADKTFIGKSLKEIAQNQGVEPEEALLNMILVAEDQLIAFIHSLSEENVAVGIASKISMEKRRLKKGFTTASWPAGFCGNHRSYETIKAGLYFNFYDSGFGVLRVDSFGQRFVFRRAEQIRQPVFLSFPANDVRPRDRFGWIFNNPEIELSDMEKSRGLDFVREHRSIDFSFHSVVRFQLWRGEPLDSFRLFFISAGRIGQIKLHFISCRVAFKQAERNFRFFNWPCSVFNDNRRRRCASHDSAGHRGFGRADHNRGHDVFRLRRQSQPSFFDFRNGHRRSFRFNQDCPLSA